MLSGNAMPATVPASHDISMASVPRWHFAMLNDKRRNQAFFDAIEATEFTGKTVLDIGTGTGLLAMLAARRGASHVYTCEFNPLVAEKAREIIRVNGLSRKITVINKLSTDLISGIDLPKDIDILISETVDCGFFGEGFGYALLHARRELLKQDAEMIPEGVRIHACLLSSQEVAELNQVCTDIFGLDVSAFNNFKTAGYFPVRLQTWQHQLASNSAEIFAADFDSDFSFTQASEIEFTATDSLLVHGVVFWFDLYLKQDICLSNSPYHERSHWMQAVQLFERPAYVRKGYLYGANFSMNEGGIKFSEGLSSCLQTVEGS